MWGTGEKQGGKKKHKAWSIFTLNSEIERRYSGRPGEGINS